jgi:hypothetical protein
MTPEQKAAEEGGGDGQGGGGDSGMIRMLQIYAVAITLLFIIVAQLYWRNRKATA